MSENAPNASLILKGRKFIKIIMQALVLQLTLAWRPQYAQMFLKWKFKSPAVSAYTSSYCSQTYPNICICKKENIKDDVTFSPLRLNG